MKKILVMAVAMVIAMSCGAMASEAYEPEDSLQIGGRSRKPVGIQAASGLPKAPKVPTVRLSPEELARTEDAMRRIQEASRLQEAPEVPADTPAQRSAFSRLVHQMKQIQAEAEGQPRKSVKEDVMELIREERRLGNENVTKWTPEASKSTEAPTELSADPKKASTQGADEPATDPKETPTQDLSFDELISSVIQGADEPATGSKKASTEADGSATSPKKASTKAAGSTASQKKEATQGPSLDELIRSVMQGADEPATGSKKASTEADGSAADPKKASTQGTDEPATNPKETPTQDLPFDEPIHNMMGSDGSDLGKAISNPEPVIRMMQPDDLEDENSSPVPHGVPHMIQYYDLDSEDEMDYV
jgi:hypothetical protein